MTKLSRLCLAILLLTGLFLRTYRQNRLLGFYYDQGRDAKIIWDLWHKHTVFLIGPTTGIEGIFLGPFYYYFIAPFYFLGNGNPVVPAIWLAVTNIAAIAAIYVICRTYLSKGVGLLSVFFMVFSLDFVQADRWLSNPTPLPLFAALCVWLTLKIINSPSRSLQWLSLGLAMGISLQLEAASAAFFLPAICLLFVIFRQHILFSVRKTISLFVSLGITLIPQIIFDFRHDHILFESFTRFLVSEKSFGASGQGFLVDRLSFYYQAFTAKFAYDKPQILALVILLVLALVFVKKHVPAKTWIVILTWWLLPLLTLLLYRGNNGYIWGYYFTGAYPFFIITISGILISAATSWFGKIILVFFVLIFISQNLPRLNSYLTAGTDGPNHVTLGSSQDAVEWVFADAGTTPFNVDAYVPPVITHSYDYLFLWLGYSKYHILPSSQQVPRLYTLFEQDPPHPERLSAWLTRQSGIGKVETQARFGGVTSQRRLRLP